MNFTLEYLLNINYFWFNWNVIEKILIDEADYFLISDPDSNYKLTKIILDNNYELELYLNEYDKVANYMWNFVSYIDPIIKNINWEEIQFIIAHDVNGELEWWCYINKDNFILKVKKTYDNKIKFLLDEVDDFYWDKTAILSEIQEKTIEIKWKKWKYRQIWALWSNFRTNDFKNFLVKDDPEIFIDWVEYIETNLSIYDLKVNWIKNKIIPENTITDSLGYSFYEVTNFELNDKNNKAIYNYEENELRTDYIFSFIGSIEEQNSKIIVWQDKKAWNFNNKTYYWLFDLNENKLIINCRYDYDEIVSKRNSLSAIKVFNAYENSLDPDMKKVLEIASEYMNAKKITEKKAEEFRKKEELIKQEEEKVKKYKQEILEEMNKEYNELQEKFALLEKNKQKIQEEYGLNIVDVLKKVSDYK